VDTVKCCLVGTGRAGLVHGRNIVKRIPQAELVALCDSDGERLATVADELGVTTVCADYEEAVAGPNVDAVVIVTPTFLHRDVACFAAAHGKHVFLEKPMAITAAECEAIIRAADEAGVKLQLGFMRRFDQSFIGVKALLDTGEMGHVMLIKSTGRGPGLPPPWIFDLEKSNGVLAEVNSHDVDCVRWLVGSDVARVYAEAANFKCPEAEPDFPDFYDNIVVNLRFEDGTLGVIDGACPCHYGYDARVEILCEKGVLFIGSVEQQGVIKVTVEGEVAGETVKSWRNLFRDAYVAEMDHFVQCILRNEPPRVTGRDGLEAVATVVAANRSLKTGAPEAVHR